MCTTTTKTTKCQSMEITPNIENIRLIYLNNSEIDTEFQLNLFKLNPAAKFYTNIQLCIDFIKSITNEKFFLILSNNFLLNNFDSFQSIIAIFIYNNNNNEIQDDLRKIYPKIIDYYSNMNNLLKSIEEKLHFIEQQIFIYSLFNQKEKLTTINLTKQSALFLWHQMLIHILKQMPSNSSIYDEMLNKCSDYYQTNSYELEQIEIFRKTYTRQQAIQWYIKECFLYRLLNRALYTKDIELLYSFRFFIIDLCLEIEREYKENFQNQEYLIVYRAQIISKEEIDKLKNNIGSLISLNGFFLTTRNRNITLEDLEKRFSINEYVLFEIHIDLSKETIFLADISSYEKQQIIFSINSLFKIESIEYDFIENLWNIKLITNNNNNNDDINEYLKFIQKEMDYHSSFVYFGHLLWNQLGQYEQAKKFFLILLKLFSNDHQDIPSIYVELGNINDEIEDYKLALNYYQYALNIREKQISKDYIRIGLLLNNIGVVYKHMGNIDQAIQFYQQSLDIYERKYSKEENQLHRANTIANLGSAYRDKKDLNIALNYLTLAYNIRQNILPNDHPLLANSLSSIGNIYHDKNDFIQALNYYQQALSIQELTYSNDDLNKANTIRNIGLIYRDKQEWTNALKYFQQTLDIRQNVLTNIHHLDIAICYGDIGYIYEKLNNLDLTLNYYQQQYEIEEIYLPIDHENLIIHFDWIINILKKQDHIDKAIEICQEKLLNLKSRFNNHPRLVRLFILLANLYEDKNPKESDQYYQQALIMLENYKNEEIFCKSLLTMIKFYWKCRMFDRALICQMKLLNYRRLTLTSNHKDIAYTLRDIGRLYRAMNKLNEALEYFEQSLVILQTNYDSEYIDVKNIQKEIFDLKDILKSISSSPNEDYNNRRISNAHKQLSIYSHNEFPSSSSSTSSTMKNNRSLTSVTKSSTCIIL